MMAQEPVFDVILPAGGRIAGAFAREVGVDVKALIRLGGQTLLGRAVEALQHTGRARRLVAIGGAAAREEALACGVDGAVEEGASGPENILRGLDWLEGQPGGVTPQLLIATTDLPFLTADAIRDFLDRCPPGADVSVPIVTRQAFEARFPGAGNEFTRLRDGEFTMGCVLCIDAETLRRSRPLFERLFAARKSNLQMARLIGVGIAWRYATGRLGIDDLLARARTLVGCEGAPVRNAPPELAYDIDLPEEYAYAHRHLVGKSAASVRPATGEEALQ